VRISEEDKVYFDGLSVNPNCKFGTALASDKLVLYFNTITSLLDVTRLLINEIPTAAPIAATLANKRTPGPNEHFSKAKIKTIVINSINIREFNTLESSPAEKPHQRNRAIIIRTI